MKNYQASLNTLKGHAITLFEEINCREAPKQIEECVENLQELVDLHTPKKPIVDDGKVYCPNHYKSSREHHALADLYVEFGYISG